MSEASLHKEQVSTKRDSKDTAVPYMVGVKGLPKEKHYWTKGPKEGSWRNSHNVF